MAIKEGDKIPSVTVKATDMSEAISDLRNSNTVVISVLLRPLVHRQ